MLLSYPNLQGRYDELFAAPGRPREPWSKLYTELTLASVPEISAMRAAAERQIRDSGVTYNVYADPKGQDRPWDLDVLPLIIDAQEWAEIESGITQRAWLLNAILGDIYGPQAVAARRADSGTAGIWAQQLPASGVQSRSARQDTSACICGRPCTLARWPLVGDG